MKSTRRVLASYGLSMIMDGERGPSREVQVTPRADDLLITFRGRTIPATVNGREPGARRRTVAAHRTASSRVVAPMPGRVVRVLVAAGDEVALRQGRRRRRSHENGKRAAVAEGRASEVDQRGARHLGRGRTRAARRRMSDGRRSRPRSRACRRSRRPPQEPRRGHGRVVPRRLGLCTRWRSSPRSSPASLSPSSPLTSGRCSRRRRRIKPPNISSGRCTSAGSSRDLRPGVFEFHDVVIEGLTPDDRPFLKAKKITVALPWWTAFNRRLIVESIDMTRMGDGDRELPGRTAQPPRTHAAVVRRKEEA